MTFLQELWDAADFKVAVNALAAEFRQKHGLPALHQLGLVVKDVEAAAADLEARGIGPFFIAAGAPVLWRERGQDRAFRGKLGMAYHQGVQFELLEPGHGSDFYRDSLDPGGEIVVQHLGFLAADVDAEAARLVAAGHSLQVRGRIKSGPLITEFAYLDTVAAAGLVIEFICWKIFTRRISPLPALLHGLGRLEKLTGKRSISV